MPLLQWLDRLIYHIKINQSIDILTKIAGHVLQPMKKAQKAG